MTIADEKHLSLLLSNVQLEAVRCPTCNRMLLEVDKDFQGVIQIKCRGCKTMCIIKRQWIKKQTKSRRQNAANSC
jgi:phage FluMu protein Com